MSIFSAPAAAFEAYTPQLPTGIAGAIAASVDDGQGTTVIAAGVATIAERPAASGLYVLSFPEAPATAGQYRVLCVYTDPDSSEVVRLVEDLHVSGIGAASIVVATPGLPGGITLEALKAEASVKRDNDDELLLRHLEDASTFAIDWTRRRLIASQGEGDDPATETIMAEGRRIVRVPDARDITEVKADGVVITAYGRKGTPEHQTVPSTSLVLAEPCDVLEVTGRFGFLTLPPTLRGAIYAQAARTYRERLSLYADSVLQADSASSGEAMYSYFRTLQPRVQAAYQMYSVSRDWMGL